MIRLTALLVASATLVSGCMPAPVMAPAPMSPVPPVPAVPAIQPVMPVSGVAGLEERQPDLCGAKTYAPYLGQPAAVIPTLGITKSYRVVEYRGIEPQEYDPNRIVFRLDAAGTVYNVDCG